jgi:hypothetical protein
MKRYLTRGGVYSNMNTENKLTDAQYNLIVALDDTSEHIAWEFNGFTHYGPGTEGSAYIENIDGRCSFIQNLKSLADEPEIDFITYSNGSYHVKVGKMKLLIQNNNGYTVKLDNVRDYVTGIEYKRVGVNKRLNQLVLQRLKSRGYLNDSVVTSINN